MAPLETGAFYDNYRPIRSPVARAIIVNFRHELGRPPKGSILKGGRAGERTATLGEQLAPARPANNPIEKVTASYLGFR